MLPTLKYRVAQIITRMVFAVKVKSKYFRVFPKHLEIPITADRRQCVDDGKTNFRGHAAFGFSVACRAQKFALTKYCRCEIIGKYKLHR